MIGYVIEGAFYCTAHARLEPGDIDEGYATPVDSADGARCIGCPAPRRQCAHCPEDRDLEPDASGKLLCGYCARHAARYPAR